MQLKQTQLRLLDIDGHLSFKQIIFSISITLKNNHVNFQQSSPYKDSTYIPK